MKSKISPFLWGSLVMAVSLALTLFIASREKVFLEANQIVSPGISLGPVVAYFFGVVVVMAVVLFIIPLSKLQLFFRILFALMFAWGVFIITALVSSQAAVYLIAVVAGVAWLIWPRIWLHDLLLLITLSSAGAVIGFLFSPWTFMIFMLIISVYDILAVRFGFMVWMADKLSGTSSLPAFVLPRNIADWTLSLKKINVGDLKDEEPEAREYTILLIQSFWLKGKPLPALPPITFFSLVGFLIALRF
jgi:presenilin-like A22 family membrane protease